MVINVNYNKNLVQNWNSCQNRRTATYELVNRALDPDECRCLPLLQKKKTRYVFLKCVPPPKKKVFVTCESICCITSGVLSPAALYLEHVSVFCCTFVALKTANAFYTEMLVPFSLTTWLNPDSKSCTFFLTYNIALQDTKYRLHSFNELTQFTNKDDNTESQSAFALLLG